MQMGIGVLGFNNLIFKRKFRFTFTVFDLCGGSGLIVPRHFVKTASRPKIEIEETELNFLNAKKWIPGKASWQSIEVTYVDVASVEMAALYNWLASVYDFTDPINLSMGSQVQDYTGTGLLQLWDGCGTELERWFLDDLWPTNIDFGDLDYSSSETVDISLTLRYSNVQYVPICPAFPIEPCCTPCQ